LLILGARIIIYVRSRIVGIEKRFETMKKVLSLLLAALMMIGTAAPVFSQKAEASLVVDAAKDIEGTAAYNGSSYKIYTEPMTWTQAKEYCEALGGHLVSITSQEEQDFIEGLLAYSEKNCCWIGGYKEGDRWKWVSGEEFEYNNWAEIEPNNENGNETRIHLFGKERTGGKGEKSVGQWNDCSEEGAAYSDEFYQLSEYGFICEWDNHIDVEELKEILKNAGEKIDEKKSALVKKMFSISSIFESLFGKNEAEPFDESDWFLENARYDEIEDCVILTEDYLTWQGGAMWYKYPVNEDFTVELDYYTGNTEGDYGGADGIVVAFYANNMYAYMNSLGVDIGYSGSGGYGVELDTHYNPERGDPKVNHIALVKGTVGNHLEGAVLNQSEDELWHHLKVQVADGVCKAYVDGQFALEGVIEEKDGNLLGITAATGAGYNLHAVKNVSVTRSKEDKNFKINLSSEKVDEDIADDKGNVFYKYEITAEIENLTGKVMKNVAAELTIDDNLYMVDEAELVKTFDIWHMGKTSVTWTVYAQKPTLFSKDAAYTVTVTDEDSLNVAKEGCIYLVSENEETSYAAVYGWPLTNSEFSFTQRNEKIDVWVEKQVKEKFGNYGGEKFGEWLGDSVKYFYEWGGRCFGMAFLSLAEYYDIIDLKPYFGNDGETLHDYGYESILTKYNGKQCFTIGGNEEVLELIEWAQDLQHSAKFKTCEMESLSNDIDFSELLDFLTSDEAKPILVVFGIFSEFMHAGVITTDYKPIAEGEGWYLISIYDPNAPVLDDRLSNPTNDYRCGNSWLRVNVNSGEYEYWVDGERIGFDRYYHLQKSIRFYDVSQLSPSLYFTTKEHTYEYDMMFMGEDIYISDKEGNVLLHIEDGSIIEISNRCTISYSADAGFSTSKSNEYMICLDVTEFSIYSDSGFAMVMDGGNLTALELNSSYTAEINCDTDTVAINSINGEADFKVCVQDEKGRAAKFTGKNLEGNRIEIKQSEEGMTVESAAAGADIDYECENMKKRQIDISEPISIADVLITAAWVMVGIVVCIGAAAAVILIIKNKKKKTA